MTTINVQTALIYVMVIAAAADGKLQDSELALMGQVVKTLPIFSKFKLDHLPLITADCAAILDDENGIDTALGLVKEALPVKLHDTAYALACFIVAIDGLTEPEELEWLRVL